MCGIEIESVLILTCFVFEQDYEGLWEEDGCYNTSLYQKTAGYHTYQQVLALSSSSTLLVVFLLNNQWIIVCSSQRECR